MILFHKKADGFNLQACDVLCAAIFFGAATYAIKAIVSFLGLSQYEEQASLIFYFLWAIIYGRFLLFNKRLILDLFVAEAIYGSLLYLNYNLYPNTQEYYEEYYMFLRQIVIVYLPSFTVTLRINDFKGYINNFRRIGIIGVSLMIIAYFMGFTERWDYQQFGINLCPFIVMIFPSYLLHHKFSYLIWMLLGFIFLMGGGRQSFVGILASMAVVYYCIRLHNISLKQMLTSALLLIMFIISAPLIIEVLGDVLAGMGMESRTLEMLTNNELFSTSTRDSIYESSIYFITHNLYNIQGLFADRYLLRLTDSWMAYPHNFILELMIDFGALFGGIISLIIFILYFWQLRKANLEKRTVIGVLATIVIIRLMVSSSFMIEGLFYTIIGLLFNPYDMISSKNKYLT